MTMSLIDVAPIPISNKLRIIIVSQVYGPSNQAQLHS